ncbi:hypothetical protein FACS1894172_05330 [Spirochaetia bacterium]|nr:hypothetical protein FACS1894164_05610 [Spirochaetia bacterium]GHU31057.1 hypothetical protein FACS1894172_05330 [Spirochaetia bacterium]
MNIEYFNEYIKNKNMGIKTKTKEYVHKFIQSFENYHEKELWTMEYLPTLQHNHNKRIRNELFEALIFPVLLNGYNNKNISVMIWLVKLEQNLIQNQKLWKIINYKSSIQIIRECYDLDPNNTEVIDIYLELKIQWIAYSIHEWPSGILIGMNGATAEQCKELVKELPFLYKLDTKNKYKAYIMDYENKLHDYIIRFR